MNRFRQKLKQEDEDALTFSLTPKQIEVRDTVLAGAASDILLYGGARSSKTFLICYAIAVRALSAPGSRHLISRLHHVDVRTSVLLDTWPKMMKLAFPTVTQKENKTDQMIILPGDAEVWFGGLDDKERVEKVLGREYASIFVNEASQVSFDTITTLRTRLAQNVNKRTGAPLALKFYADLNPVGRRHWTYREFVEHVDPLTGNPLTPEEAARHAWAVMNPQDNPHLPAAALARLAGLPHRQRLRYFDGSYAAETPGALWSLDQIDRLRVRDVPDLNRIVVAIDPSGSDGSGGDNIGIVAVGRGEDGHFYVLADISTTKGPSGWATDAVGLYRRLQADVLVAEANYGGAMVEATIRTVDGGINYLPVTATRGKHVRAEPIAALYEQGKVHHCGVYPELESQLSSFNTDGFQGSGSPGNADALVWAMTELSPNSKTFDAEQYIKAYLG